MPISFKLIYQIDKRRTLKITSVYLLRQLTTTGRVVQGEKKEKLLTYYVAKGEFNSKI